jgi:hypothetical protein
VFCEGEVTEPEYYAYVKKVLRDSLLTISIARTRGDPMKLVLAAIDAKADAAQKARRYQDDNLAFDAVWCVVDVDRHERLPDALRLAKRNGILVAVSNPCFELWALLHFAAQTSFVAAAEARQLLRTFMPRYRKSLDCSRLAGRYGDARRRASDLRARHANNGDDIRSNPSTDVDVLNEALLLAARRSGARVDTL